jgi:hypothetical protein
MRYSNAEEFKSENGYEVNGGWYPRVTKILEIKSKPGLENFFKEIGSWASAEAVKEQSAKEGSMLHDAVQRVTVGEIIEIPPEVAPAVLAFQEFNETRKIYFYPEFVERRVWSPRYRYAGTVDALAEVDGKFGVLDIKTSTGFYPEYNLQTAAYISALQELEVKRMLKLPKEIETRWILRIDQHRECMSCRALLREKGGRKKIRTPYVKNSNAVNKEVCPKEMHEWGATKGVVELREYPYFYNDIKAFMAAKILWEWEYGYWLKQAGYLS